MLFAGPPGHGKTELACQLGKLVVNSEESSIKIQCETLETKWELQGSALGYQGNAQGSPLNNFISSHNGKPGVVILDEFEKTQLEVQV
jgi:ATP-dependent Clp protease ATP-binding subunit ClpA